MRTTVIIIVVVLIVLYSIFGRGEKTYECPKCKKSFNRKAVGSVHVFDAVLLTCPHCGATSMMRPTKKPPQE